jgi:hypothetical protein
MRQIVLLKMRLTRIKMDRHVITIKSTHQEETILNIYLFSYKASEAKVTK